MPPILPMPAFLRRPAPTRPTAHGHRTAAILVVLALLSGPVGCRQGQDAAEHGGAATGDDLDSRAAGSSVSNDSIQRQRPVNDTLPGRDTNPSQQEARNRRPPP